MSVGTAFFERQRELNTKLSWGEWSGYHAAAVFADFVDIEYNAVREAAKPAPAQHTEPVGQGVEVGRRGHLRVLRSAQPEREQ